MIGLIICKYIRYGLFMQCCNCKVLLIAGAKLTADEDGWTPLHAAAGSTVPDCDVVGLLVDAVVRSGNISLLDAKTKDGKNTALHLAAANEKTLFPVRCGPYRN